MFQQKGLQYEDETRPQKGMNPFKVRHFHRRPGANAGFRGARFKQELPGSKFLPVLRNQEKP